MGRLQPVPQGLKASSTPVFTARLNPCPSSNGVCALVLVQNRPFLKTGRPGVIFGNLLWRYTQSIELLTPNRGTARLRSVDNCKTSDGAGLTAPNPSTSPTSPQWWSFPDSWVLRRLVVVTEMAKL
jgi:hypothetical protein